MPGYRRHSGDRGSRERSPGDRDRPVLVGLRGDHAIQSNIFILTANITIGSGSPLITHNDFVWERSLVIPETSVVNDNLEAQDPRFCAPGMDDYTLDKNSPCVAKAHDGGDIGALGVGCDLVTVQPTTWGSLKRRYR